MKCLHNYYGLVLSLLMNRWDWLFPLFEANLLVPFKHRKFILKHNQQDATLYNIFYCCQCSTCFERFFRLIIRSSKAVHTASGVCQACLLLPLTWMSWNSPTLAVAASKFDNYPRLDVQFLSSWWWAEKTARNMYSTDSNKEYCIALHLVGYA